MADQNFGRRRPGFSWFSLLPPETQTDVWRAVSTIPRCVTISLAGNNVCEASPTTPGMLSATRESRFEARRTYTPQFAAQLRNQGPVYFNLETDILYFETEDTLHQWCGAPVYNRWDPAVLVAQNRGIRRIAIGGFDYERDLFPRDIINGIRSMSDLETIYFQESDDIALARKRQGRVAQGHPPNYESDSDAFEVVDTYDIPRMIQEDYVDDARRYINNRFRGHRWSARPLDFDARPPVVTADIVFLR